MEMMNCKKNFGNNKFILVVVYYSCLQQLHMNLKKEVFMGGENRGSGGTNFRGSGGTN